MPALIFPWQGKELVFEYRLLFAFADCFPVHEKHLPLALALAKMSLPSIAQAIFQRFEINRELQLLLFERLWPGETCADKHRRLDLRRQLLWQEHFVQNLSCSQAEWILAQADPAMLAALAWRADFFCGKGATKLARLDRESAERIREAIEKSELHVVKSILSPGRKSASGSFSLLKLMNLDEYRGHLDLSLMTPEDAAVLQYLPIQAMVGLAHSLYSVSDKKLQFRLYWQLLRGHDPLPRVILGVNRRTPGWVRDRLGRDPDSDVRLAALSPPDEDCRSPLIFH